MTAKHKYDPPDQVLTSEDWQEALDSQGLTDLNELVSKFNSVLGKIKKEADARGVGVHWVNSHPINLFYTKRICELAHVQIGRKKYARLIRAIEEANRHL
jgi:hypothetical protein